MMTTRQERVQSHVLAYPLFFCLAQIELFTRNRRIEFDLSSQDHRSLRRRFAPSVKDLGNHHIRGVGLKLCIPQTFLRNSEYSGSHVLLYTKISTLGLTNRMTRLSTFPTQ